MDSNGGLARSVTSFRRNGSSGVVWDDKFLINDEVVIDVRELRPSHSVGSIGMTQGSWSTGVGDNGSGGGGRGGRRGGSSVVYQMVKVASPPKVDPPPPRVSGCGLCGIFGKPVTKKSK